VVEADGLEYTQARSDTEIRVLCVDGGQRVGRATLHLGSVEVATRIHGYQRRDVRSREIIANEKLSLPEQQLTTRAFWYVIDADLIDELTAAGFDAPGTLHAAEHAAIGMLPLFTICDRWDVGGVSTARHADTNGATIFIYDGSPGGAGIAELGWEAAAEHLRATLEVVEACGCVEGCPSCVQSPKCGSGNEPLDKDGSVDLIRRILGPPTPEFQGK
jgi:DEAD/DEAH box helicase domain-containing protein